MSTILGFGIEGFSFMGVSLAQSLTLAQATAAGTAFELGRIESLADWILPVLVLAVMGWFVIGMYVLDCVELGGRRAAFLITLRLLAVAGLLAVYLQPQYRTKREVVRNSRVLVLADTSQSMQRRDVDGTLSAGSPSRIEAVAAALSEGNLIGRLRAQHDVTVYGFDHDEKPVTLANFRRSAAADPELPEATTDEATRAAIDEARTTLTVLSLGLLVAACGGGWFLLRGNHRGGGLPLGIAGLGVAVVVIMGARYAGQADKPDLLTIVGANQRPETPAVSEESETVDQEESDIDWSELLVAGGTETRLGQAVYSVIQDERTTPVSAVLVFSDGGWNAGLQPETAIQEAIDAEIPIYTVGVGSPDLPSSVRLSDFTAPQRAYPGDGFNISAYVQAQGLGGRDVAVTLRQIPVGRISDSGEVPGELVDEHIIRLGTDGEDVAVEFPMPGIELAGEYAFEISVETPRGAEQQREQRRRFRIDVVDHTTRVLLVAGGPSREYQFLRNQLRRDEGVEIDVFLQSAGENISQDADRILEDFPATTEELFEYDCIVAFDPNWNDLELQQAALLERWVAEEAGGLIVIPGPVFVGRRINSWAEEPRLAEDPRMQLIRAMYPVEFFDRRSAGALERTDFTEAFPLEFTREGRAAEFLLLGESEIESQANWGNFSGVYGAYPVRAAKPGATVYARSANPTAEATGSDPVYMAGHFYGSGRVFYLGSGEMWRLREIDTNFFDALYTKLIRHVSQGRLLRGSRRGDVLLVEKDRYGLGETVSVVAHLKNAQREPYRGDRVTLYAGGPDGRNVPLDLRADPSRDGMFTGQFTVRREGDHELLLPLPESDETLSRTIRVVASALENENPQLQDALLKRMANDTGGRYYFGTGAALGIGGDPGVADHLQDRTEITPIEGDINPLWNALWARWMLFGIAGVLCLEWLTRRLLRLA